MAVQARAWEGANKYFDLGTRHEITYALAGRTVCKDALSDKFKKIT